MVIKMKQLLVTKQNGTSEGKEIAGKT